MSIGSTTASTSTGRHQMRTAAATRTRRRIQQQGSSIIVVVNVQRRARGGCLLMMLLLLCCWGTLSMVRAEAAFTSSSKSLSLSLPLSTGLLAAADAAAGDAVADAAALSELPPRLAKEKVGEGTRTILNLRTTTTITRQLQQGASTGDNDSGSSESCVVEYATFTTCVETYRTNVSTLTSALMGCDDCVVGYWNVSLASAPPATSPAQEGTDGISSNGSSLQASAYCEQLQRGTCLGWHQCRKECPRKCKSELVTLVNCIAHCELTPLQQCPERYNGTNVTNVSAPTSVPTLALSTPPPTPPPAPAPVNVPQQPSQPILEVCERQRLGLQSCWLAQQQGQDAGSHTAELNQCTRCLLQQLSGYNSSTLCVQYQRGVCAAISDCPCWNCGPQQLAFMECLTACTFQCPNTSGGGGGGSGSIPTSTPIALQPSTFLPTRFPTLPPQRTLSPVARSDMVPTSSPASISPTSTQGSSNNCLTQKQSMNQCLGFNGTSGISPCEACIVNASWPALPKVCRDIENATCQGWDLCQDICNNNCQTEFFAYATCETTCNFPCYDDPGNNGTTSAPTPRNASVCSAEYAAFDNCVNPVQLGYACERCVTSYWPIQSSTSPTLQCSDLDNATCWGLQECANVCNGCDAELLTVVTCLSECNGTFECSSSSAATPTTSPSLGLSSTEPTPTSSSSSGGCSSFDQAVVQCFLADNRNATPCGNCLAALAPDPCPANGTDGNLCASFEQQCGAVCSPCQSNVQDAVNCYAGLANCGAVQLVCTSNSTTGGNTPTASPVPSASSVEPTSAAVDTTCSDQKSAVDQCLSDQLDSAAKDSCEACVETVYGKLINAIEETSGNLTTNARTCDQVNTAVCRALSQSCACGPCTSEYGTYLDCRVDVQPIVQSGECTLRCNSTTTFGSNSTSRSTSGVGRRSLMEGGSTAWVVLMTSFALYGVLVTL